MLIYEKKVQGVNHLFGTEGNVPSESDEQLSYKDNVGNEVDVSDMVFFYDKKGTIYGNESKLQIPTNEDEKILVYLGDELIIGTVDEVAITCNKITNVKITVPEKAPRGSEVEITVEARGEHNISEPTITVNGDEVSVTEVTQWKKYTATVEATDDLDIVVSTTVDPE